MEFNDILESMLGDMKKFHRSRNELLPYYITKRLNDSLSVYYKELSNSFNYLSKKDGQKMMKKMNEYEQ